MLTFENRFLIKSSKNVKKLRHKIAKSIFEQTGKKREFNRNHEQLSAEVTTNWFDRTHCGKQSAVLC